MSAKNVSKSRLFLQYAMVALGLFAANNAVAGRECQCDRGIKPVDMSHLVTGFALPLDMPVLESKEVALTPESLMAREDANSFVYPMYLHEGVWYVRFGFEEKDQSWGPNGGKILVGSREDMHDGAVREFTEENAGGITISKATFAAFAQVFATKNHFGLPEVLYFINMTSVIPQGLVADALARVRANAEDERCAKVAKNPKKTCSFATVTDHVWVAFADVYDNFFSPVASGKFPYYQHSMDKTLAKDQMIMARVLMVDAEGKITGMEKRELNTRRNATPSHFRNVTYAHANAKLAGQEELIHAHADHAMPFFRFLAGAVEVAAAQ